MIFLNISYPSFLMFFLGGIHLSDTDVITHTNKESANAIKPSFHFITQLETPKEDELTGNPRSRSAKVCAF